MLIKHYNYGKSTTTWPKNIMRHLKKETNIDISDASLTGIVSR